MEHAVAQRVHPHSHSQVWMGPAGSTHGSGGGDDGGAAASSSCAAEEAAAAEGAAEAAGGQPAGASPARQRVGSTLSARRAAVADAGAQRGALRQRTERLMRYLLELQVCAQFASLAVSSQVI